MKLITISGLDGSGKSTQIQLLKEYLETQGKKVFYFHAIQFSIANKFSGKKEAGQSKGVTEANILQLALRKIFLQIDMWRFKKLHTQLCNSGYDYILSDRYFYDSLINIEYLAKESAWTLGVQVPDLAFFMEVAPELIMQRERKPDQGLEYLKVKNALFRNKIIQWNMQTIDASRDKNIIFEELKKLCQL